MRRAPTGLRLLCLLLPTACRSAGVAAPPADAIVEGRVAPGVHSDTTDAPASILVSRAPWSLHTRIEERQDFWSDIAVLDLPSADRAATTVDEHTFVFAMRTLLGGVPDDAAVAFGALYSQARDPVLRSRARIGLTMALSWRSDWPTIASIPTRTSTADALDARSDDGALEAGVERWARALAAMPSPVLDLPDGTVTVPMRRSAFGTPVITVTINGRPHEFWLDTGASMTVLSARVALDAGVGLASTDTLALGVVAGQIPARAGFVDSLSIGAVRVRALSVAVVNSDVLRLDRRVVNGRVEEVPVDGVIGTDILRHLDLVLDARAGTVTMSRPRHDARARPIAARNLFWIGFPVVRLVTRDGRPMLFGLDTGAENSYVTTALLRKLPDTPVAARRGSLGGLGGEQQKTQWVARRIALSDGSYALDLRNIPVAPERRWTFFTFDGMIGADVALASRMHLDFENGIFDIHASALDDAGIIVK